MNEKQKFISKYLTKHMKNRPRQFGIEYMNILADCEAKAEQAWRVKMQRVAQKCNPKKRTK